jgi:ubiquinone biosynthesis protein
LKKSFRRSISRQRVDWASLIDEAVIGTLLSEEIAHFARPIREAFIIFLSGLPDSAQQDILSAQAALPASAGVSERLGVLMQQCPVLHKLGQALARDRRIDAKLRRELRKLEALPAAVPLETIEAALRDEIGDLGQLGITLDAAAIAEASVAVVIGYRDQGPGGVFKVLKPGIEERLGIELELLGKVGAFLDERCSELAIPRLSYEETFRQVREKLLDEAQLRVEQRHLGLAAEQFARDEAVVVPALRPYCSARLTAMERIAGTKVTDHALRSVSARSRLASLIAGALLVRPVFSTGDSVIFHGDPHAGNLFLTPDRRLAILDWSLAGRLSQRHREAMVHVLLGAMMLDEQRVIEMLLRLSERPSRYPAQLAVTVQRHMQRIRSGQLPDFPWVLRLMDDAFMEGGLDADSDLLLYRKSLYTLEGVITDVAPNPRTIEHAFFFDFVRHLVTEAPQRWLSTIDSRAFATRLSNMDLTQLALSVPFAAARFWLGGNAQRRRTPS